jgi:hypothetical protein
MTNTVENVDDLLEAWKLASQKIADLTLDIEKKTAEEAESSVLDPLREQLEDAKKDESATKTSLFDEWSKLKQSTAASGDRDATQKTEPEVTSDRPTSDILGSSNKPDIITIRDETPMTARFTAPKEYKHGDNFTIWCSRFRRYLRASRIQRDDAFELLLNHVDDRTLETLEPVADRLTTFEKRDPEKFIPIFEQAIYPKSDIRSLRQLMTNGNLIQEESEDVDTFASRVRSLAKRAYNNPSERHEPCLNAFLNGMRDGNLFDKVISVPGAEDNFDLAVESARKFEKLRRTNRNFNQPEQDSFNVLRLNNNSNRDNPRDERSQGNGDNRRNRQGQNYGSNDTRNSNTRGSDGNRGNNQTSGNRRENRTCYLCQHC